MNQIRVIAARMRSTQVSFIHTSPLSAALDEQLKKKLDDCVHNAPVVVFMFVPHFIPFYSHF